MKKTMEVASVAKALSIRSNSLAVNLSELTFILLILNGYYFDKL